jgi:hypothetical protein
VHRARKERYIDFIIALGESVLLISIDNK